ncbi:MAG: C1 family peptidase [Bacteroidota bacterium]
MWLFVGQVLLAQQNYATGMLFEDSHYDSLSTMSQDIEGAKSLPLKVDLTPYCPAIRHQGDIFSCVGWSVGYAVLTIERAIQNNWLDKKYITENAYSALFVYNQIKSKNCHTGAQITAALELLEHKGNCLARHFDFDPNDCETLPDSSVLQAAQVHTISHYIKLFEQKDANDLKVRKVKQVLAHQKPVIIGMKVLRNFYELKNARFWWPNIGDQTFAGGHAMCVVGYDDEQKAFRLMNSWGKNWGNEGFIWVKYQHFAEYCKYAYAIFLEQGGTIDFSEQQSSEISEPSYEVAAPTSQLPPLMRPIRELNGSFVFQRFEGWGSDQRPVFESMPVFFDQKSYHLKGQYFRGDRFQLLAETGFDNGYVYAFSIDAVGKTAVHFPKHERLNKKFARQYESALLLSGGSKLTIPSATKVLKLTQMGNDYLVCLFSEKRIKPRYIRYLCATLGQHPNNIWKTLENLLGEHLIPLHDIHYEMDAMRFAVQTRSKGSIVPVVLRVLVE